MRRRTRRGRWRGRWRGRGSFVATRAVCFDVDFTLIYPGPVFEGEGYRIVGAKHGLRLEVARFRHAVASASPLLEVDEALYDEEIFLGYTRHVIERMGGVGPGVATCARELYDEWGRCHHFELYEEVPRVLEDLAAAGLVIGLISNSHRCLESFQSHFGLADLVTAAVSSFEHGYLKPHPSIFQTALHQLGAAPGETMMVGDSVRQDVDGARAVGMRAVLLHRGDEPHPEAPRLTSIGVPIVGSLTALRDLL